MTRRHALSILMRLRDSRILDTNWIDYINVLCGVICKGSYSPEVAKRMSELWAWECLSDVYREELQRIYIAYTTDKWVSCPDTVNDRCIDCQFKETPNDD